MAGIDGDGSGSGSGSGDGLAMAMAKKTLMTIIAYNKWVHYGHLTKGEQGTTRRVSNPLPPTLI